MSTAGEVESVRRAFVSFVALVIVPVVGLVGFGILAISHERAAVEKRVADEYTPRLRTIAEELGRRVADATHALDSADAPLPPLARFRFQVQDGVFTATPEVRNGSTEALVAAIRSADPTVDAQPTLIQLGRGPARGVYAVRRRSTATGIVDEGLALSTPALAATVEAAAARLFPDLPGRITLQAPPEPLPLAPTATTVYRLIDEVTSEDRPASLATLPLPDPLADWRLIATPAGDDPIQEALVRNRTVYIVLLALFYVAITIGIVLTMRRILRQAALSRLKTDFVSNISHELRTPLTSIRMFAETLRQGRVRTEEERLEALDFIAREAERLSVLTERTLDWARLDAGRRRFLLERTEPATLVDSAVSTFLSLRPLAPGVLETACEPSLPTIEVDRPAVTQVLLNLLENAVKYTGPEKRIRLKVRRTRRGIAIDVTDNGVGIAKRDHKKVFERFYRANDLLARETEGTGLGLSIAQRIVQSHGGRIRLQSEPGRGSTFTVELPSATGRDGAAPVAAEGRA